MVAVGQVVKGARGASNVAHVTQMNGDAPELVAANARLISAGPEMLAALQVAERCVSADRDSAYESYVNQVTGEIDDLDDRAHVDDLDATLGAIRAAIAKATGAAA